MDRSWIIVESDPIATGGGPIPPAAHVYLPQPCMTACADCGNNPIKFKDSIFIVDPEPCAVWPSRWFCVGRPDFAARIETFQRRKEKSSVG